MEGTGRRRVESFLGGRRAAEASSEDVRAKSRRDLNILLDLLERSQTDRNPFISTGPIADQVIRNTLEAIKAIGQFPNQPALVEMIKTTPAIIAACILRIMQTPFVVLSEDSQKIIAARLEIDMPNDAPLSAATEKTRTSFFYNFNKKPIELPLLSSNSEVDIGILADINLLKRIIDASLKFQDLSKEDDIGMILPTKIGPAIVSDQIVKRGVFFAYLLLDSVCKVRSMASTNIYDDPDHYQNLEEAAVSQQAAASAAAAPSAEQPVAAAAEANTTSVSPPQRPTPLPRKPPSANTSPVAAAAAARPDKTAAVAADAAAAAAAEANTTTGERLKMTPRLPRKPSSASASHDSTVAAAAAKPAIDSNLVSRTGRPTPPPRRKTNPSASTSPVEAAAAAAAADPNRPDLGSSRQ